MTLLIRIFSELFWANWLAVSKTVKVMTVSANCPTGSTPGVGVNRRLRIAWDNCAGVANVMLVVEIVPNWGFDWVITALTFWLPPSSGSTTKPVGNSRKAESASDLFTV